MDAESGSGGMGNRASIDIIKMRACARPGPLFISDGRRPPAAPPPSTTGRLGSYLRAVRVECSRDSNESHDVHVGREAPTG
ncbi:hypothetical protein EVAR_63680_1 [Eumeta japonica]|uniref:Uncharacterized protein n=1 Tax=Eumeta variegata TaxID=151549 RepID=A0A4C1ZTP8_EUMVA|nr:hypothetical protein EVAR_63680_1 [Eumeta japonica]